MTLKIKDLEKFKSMWLKDEMSPKEIAEYFGVCPAYVHQKRKVLGLSPKGTRGFGMAENMKRKGERTARKILKFLKAEGGFCCWKILRTKFSDGTLHKLIHERRIFIVTFDFGRSSGYNAMRKKHGLIFNEPYIFKSYGCLSRTAIIRLMSQALKKPKTKELRVTVTFFLRRYLSDAERIAVLWKLGIRNWHREQVKSSIQIDGIVKAKNQTPRLSLNSS